MELRGGRTGGRRTDLCLLIVTAVCLALFAGVAAAATPTGQVSPAVTVSPAEQVSPGGTVTTQTTITPTTTITAIPGAQESLPFGGHPYLWGLIFCLIALLFSLPWLVHTWINYHSRQRAFELAGAITDSKEKADLLKELAGPLPSRKGLTRFTIITGVILIIAAALLYMAVTNPAGQLFQTTLGVLTGAFSTIIGFYFGGAAAETKSKDQAEANVAVAQEVTEAVVRGVAEGKRP